MQGLGADKLRQVRTPGREPFLASELGLRRGVLASIQWALPPARSLPWVSVRGFLSAGPQACHTYCPWSLHTGVLSLFSPEKHIFHRSLGNSGGW